MVLVITCKNEDDSIKNKGARVDTTFSPLYIDFVDAEGQFTPQSAVGYGPSKLIKAFFMHGFFSCKHHKDRIKIKQEKCRHHYTHYMSMGIFQTLNDS